MALYLGNKEVAAVVKVSTGEGGDVTEYVKQIIVGTWEYTTQNDEYGEMKLTTVYNYDGTLVNTLTIGGQESNPEHGTYTVENTNIKYTVNAIGGGTSSGTDVYNVETNTITTKNNQVLEKVVASTELTLEAIVGYWKTPEEGLYFQFKDDYTIGAFADGQPIPDTGLRFSIENGKLMVTEDGTTGEVQYNPNDCTLLLGGTTLHKLNPSGTLDITENGTHFVAPYEEVNVNVAGGNGNVDSGGEYLVQIVDYDGTVLKKEYLNSGDIFTLPEFPIHDNLIAQQWVCPVDIVDNTVTIVHSDIVIGISYITTSGLTELDIIVNEETGLTISNVPVNSSVDWGDGNSDASTSHTYLDYGQYTIKADLHNLPNFTNVNPDKFIKNIRCGSGISALRNCNYMANLETITFSENVVDLDNQTLYWNPKLKCITFPNSIKYRQYYGSPSASWCGALKFFIVPKCDFSYIAINKSFNLECLSIPEGILYLYTDSFIAGSKIKRQTISIPDSVTMIGNGAFNGCNLKKIIFGAGLQEINGPMCREMSELETLDFRYVINVPTASQDPITWNGFSPLLKIIVPDELYEEWVVATNWATFADYIYKASEMEG